MKNFSIKQIAIAGAIIFVIISTIGIYIYKNMINQEKDDIMYEYENANVENISIEEEQYDKIMIHIFGCVREEGIVILNEGDRIIDALEAAGGESEDADLNKINLAYVLKDGERLYIPSKSDNENTEYISSNSGDNIIVEGAGNMNNEEKTSIININTATKEELMSLTGIGESTANKIISYREENGKFNKIEDIKNVPGIGDAKFEAIKDDIKV